MTQASTTTTIECTDRVVPQVLSPTVALQPSHSHTTQAAITEDAAPEPEQDHKLARPYLKLLMPEPKPDQDCDAELRKEDCRYYLYVLSRGCANKDWMSTPVFDEDEEDDEPLPSLLGETW